MWISTYGYELKYYALIITFNRILCTTIQLKNIVSIMGIKYVFYRYIILL